MKSLIFPLLGVIVTIYMPAQTGKGKLPNTIPGAEFAVIKGMGHDGSLKFTDEIVNAIVKHVSK